MAVAIDSDLLAAVKDMASASEAAQLERYIGGEQTPASGLVKIIGLDG